MRRPGSSAACGCRTASSNTPDRTKVGAVAVRPPDLEVADLVVRYHDGSTALTALEIARLSVPAGSLLVVTGPSGSLSLLRMSAWQRLAGAAAVAALLWLAVWWATA